MFRDFNTFYYEITLPDDTTEEGCLSGMNFENYVDVTDLTEAGNLPNQYILSQNYPNPFNPETQIRYYLPRACQVKLTVYNILGRAVRVLLDEKQSAGHNDVKWNGRDEKGDEVSTGIYFYQIKTREFTDTKKMVILK